VKSIFFDKALQILVINYLLVRKMKKKKRPCKFEFTCMEKSKNVKQSRISLRNGTRHVTFLYSFHSLYKLHFSTTSQPLLRRFSSNPPQFNPHNLHTWLLRPPPTNQILLPLPTTWEHSISLIELCWHRSPE